MKKVLSVVLSIALLMTFAMGILPVSAEEVDLLNSSEFAAGADNRLDGDAKLENGVLTITIVNDAVPGGAEVGAEAAVNVPFNVADDLHAILNIESDVPFKVTFHTEADKWIGFQNEYFNLFYREDGTALTGEDLVGVDKYLPAGSYQVEASLKGYYDSNLPGVPSDTINGVYIGGMSKGTITVKQFTLVPKAGATTGTETNLLDGTTNFTAGGDNHLFGSAIKENGNLTISIVRDAIEKESEVGAEAAVDVPLNLADEPYALLSITSDVPFKVTFHTETDKWIGFQNEYFNLFYREDGTALTGEDLVGVDKYLPAGSYTVAAPIKGYYDYNLPEVTSDAIKGIVIGGMNIGTITVKNLSLITKAELKDHPTEEPVLGDIDRDYSPLMIEDAAELYLATSGKQALDPVVRDRGVADICADGEVDTIDAYFLYLRVAGLAA